MEYKVLGNKIALRVNLGEEILSSIEKVCLRENVTLGVVSGIGAIHSVRAGLYDIGTKDYFESTFSGSFEITNLTGSITTMAGRFYPHIHITWSDSDFNAYGGHLKEATVGATAEIFIEKIDGIIERRLDEATGLNVMDFNPPQKC